MLHIIIIDYNYSGSKEGLTNWRKVLDMRWDTIYRGNIIGHNTSLFILILLIVPEFTDLEYRYAGKYIV